MADIIITPGSSLMSFTSSLNYTQTLAQDASGSLTLQGSGSTGRTDLFTVNGNNGTLFSVSDDLSNSLFSVNTIAGLPVIEAFADNTVVMGQYGQNVLVVTGSGVSIGSSSPSGYKFKVSGTSVFENEQVIAYTNAIQTITGYSGYSLLRMYGNNNGVEVQLDAHSHNGTAGTVGTFSNSDFFIKTNNSNRISVKAGGNVGIGTTNPQEKLSVDGGSIRFNYDNASANYYLYLNRKASQDGGILLLKDNTTDWQITNEGSGGDLRFYSYGISAFALSMIKSTGNIGIGTTSPSSKLQINASTSDGIILRTTSNAEPFIALQRNNASNGVGVFRLEDGGALYFDNGATGAAQSTKMTILGGGNVGIGVGNPDYKFHVYDTSSGNARILVQGTSNYTLFQSTNSSGTIYIGIDNSSGSGFGQGAYSRVFYSEGNYPLAISTNGTEKMRILSGGNVGIGTTSPAQKLHVVGNTAVTGITSTGDRKLSLGILDLNSGGTPTQIRINTTIPFNSPSADFTVNIKGFRYGAPQMVSLSIGWHYYLSSFYNETAISNGAWKPTISLAQDAGGFVVIHLSSPAYWPKLYVESVYSSAYGDIYSSGWNWTDADLSNCTNVEVVPYQALATDITGNAGSTSAVSGTTNYVSKFTSATAIGNSQIFDNGTNVGIGTTSPGYKLEVNGTSYFSGLAYFGQTAAGGSAFRWGALGSAVSVDTMLTHNQLWNGSGWTILDSGVGTSYLNLGSQVSSPDIQFGTGPTNTAATTKMIIKNGGNVGIGTTNPANKFVVSDNGGIGLEFNPNYLSEAYIASYNRSSATYTNLNFEASNIFFRTGASATLRGVVDSSGNFGIGTTSPAFPLDVNGSANVKGSITGQDSSNNYRYEFAPELAYTRVGVGGVGTYKINSGAVSTTSMLRIKSTSTSGWLSSQANYFNGTVISDGLCDVAISTVGTLLFLNTNGEWGIADADVAAKSVTLLGIALNTTSGVGETVDVLIDGIITLKSNHDQISIPASPGAPIYVSTNAGNVTEVAPSGTGDIVRLVGHNVWSATSPQNTAIIRFQPDNTWIEL